MQRKTILVTGATDGIGKLAALKLAGAGATVLLHGRSPQRCAAAMAEIRAAVPSARLRPFVADFESLSDVLALACRVAAREPRLDALVNNAGVGIEPARRVTADGHELTFQVNYLAGYALGTALAPLLARGPVPGRIVCVSSSSQAVLDFDDPGFASGWDGIEAYGRSKWAQACFAAGYARHLPAGAVTINAVHPGDFMPTKLVLGRFPVRDTIEIGADSIVRLATDPNQEGITGQYFDRTTPSRAIPPTYDATLQDRLLALSDAMLAPARERLPRDSGVLRHEHLFA